ncbi:hypothetical protein [Dokdonia sp.]|uniref:hypothetical protein n=1 Tax=Dokdonia sp. TaxID=2024995 RepID=UPI003264BA3F
MKKYLLIPFLFLIACSANNDLEQAQIENWIVENTKETRFSTRLKNNYGATHRVTMENIRVSDIGLLNIVDETTRNIAAEVRYQEDYYNGDWSKKNDRQVICVFIFKKSTDDKWYISYIQGNNDYTFSKWVNHIFKKNKRKPIK